MRGWIKCSEQLPEVFEKVLVQFKTADTNIKHIFVAYMNISQEWDLYQLYTSFPIDKTKLVPLFWMPITPPRED